ncbi:MAG: SxtJ family membrane protein [Planctomycetes bacterium]|nr:SxtJ family membrane protein [Planctomycetota bacterium]
MKRYATLSDRDMAGSGQALVLICLLLGLLVGGRGWLWAAVVALVLNMASPRLFRPFAYLWLNFAHVLGVVVGSIVLACQFFLLVLPVGLVRRLLGRDAMALRQWRQGDGSVFVQRNHTYGPDDLRHPY